MLSRRPRRFRAAVDPYGRIAAGKSAAPAERTGILADSGLYCELNVLDWTRATGATPLLIRLCCGLPEVASPTGRRSNPADRAERFSGSDDCTAPTPPDATNRHGRDRRTTDGCYREQRVLEFNFRRWRFFYCQKALKKEKKVDSIVGWWPLDEIGSEAEELVHGNHGDYVEVPLEADGKVGGALRFDGSNDVIEIQDPGTNWVFDISGDITLETWIKRDTDQSGQQVIVGKSGSYYLGCRAGYVFALIPNSFDFIGASKMPVGEWLHLAVTYDVDDRIGRIYVDGEIDGAVSTTGQNVPVGNGHIYIAGLMPPQQFFDGFIDEVTIYRRALSTAEILEIYNRGSLGKCKN